MGVEVLVVQHGEKVRAAGHPGLTETGVRQAAAVAARLRRNRTEVSSVWASPLEREQQTAERIAAAFDLAVQTDGRLRERMNWDDEAETSLETFLAEWQSRRSEDRTYEPTKESSSGAAAGASLPHWSTSAGQPMREPSWWSLTMESPWTRCHHRRRRSRQRRGSRSHRQRRAMRNHRGCGSTGTSSPSTRFRRPPTWMRQISSMSTSSSSTRTFGPLPDGLVDQLDDLWPS